MTPRKRRKFSAEFKAEAVALCRLGDRSITKVAQDLDVTPSVMHEWVRQAETDAAASPNGPLTSSEREELQRLRRDNKRLELEREILKKAAAFFAKESS
jgi:transposase-like protein